MNPESSGSAQRGKRIALTIACILVVLAVLGSIGTLFAPQGGGWAGASLQLGLGLAMPWLIFKGYGWARSYLAVSLMLSAVLTLFTLPHQFGVLGLLLALPIVAVYGTCGWFVWSSRALDDYCDEQYQKRNPSMTMFS